MSRKVLVTGGAGFIGSHLVDRLVKEGCEVTVFDDLSAGHLDNLAEVRKQINFMEGDICNLAKLGEAGSGCTAIFHLAAVANVSQSLSQPLRVHEVNATGTLNVCEVASANRAKIIFCSSAATYGNQQVFPIPESATQVPLSLYGVQKLMGEHYLRTYSDLFSVPSVALRYFNVFGPRQDPSSPYSGVISIFVDKLKKGDPLVIFGDGRQYRDFVYVSDVVEANWLAYVQHASGHLAVNVARGERTTIASLAQQLAVILEVHAEIRNEVSRAGDIQESVAQIARIRDAFGWEPKVSVLDGLKMTI